MEDKAVVLFDGFCNLCIASVRFIIKRDPQDNFRFASLQSELGRKILEDKGLTLEAVDTLVLVAGSRCLTRSDAAIGIAKGLTGFWPVLGVLSIVPRPVRDKCYALVARNRYKWFGRQETCMIPSQETPDRFLQ
ncbi:MAG: thiol-disulfide oxidoreductase DCC family protein [Candidatus Binatia bacterium]